MIGTIANRAAIRAGGGTGTAEAIAGMIRAGAVAPSGTRPSVAPNRAERRRAGRIAAMLRVGAVVGTILATMAASGGTAD